MCPGNALQVEHYDPLSKIAAIRQERRSIDELNPAEYNPRKRLKPGDEEYESLKRSIETFGYVDPIIINADGTVIGGHQRLFVLRDLGYSDADVAVVDLSKNDEKALNIALNKISGEWDEEKLAAIFADLDADGYDLRLTGFAEDEITVALVDAIDGDLEIVGDVPFSEVLREEHNYIVLYFDNEVDWLQAESLFALETVKAYSTRKDGKISPSQIKKGVGRVVRGSEALEALRSAYLCELPEL